jgi:hypothetical protein
MTSTAGSSRPVAVAMLVAALVAVVAAGLGAGVRTTFGGQAAVDEPQYLLTSLSLWEDHSLDISDELAERRWRDFHDAELPVQTEVLDGGRQVSPHDPLLPLLLAAPMGIGGWLAAKLTLALLAGGVAALTVWVAVRRFGVRPWLAGAGTAVVAASPPLAVYGQQVYPELPAAGAVLVGVAAATGRLGARGVALAGLAVVALPWLSVKYAPVAAVLALLVLWRLARAGRPGGRRAALSLAGGLGAAGVLYLVLHQVWWGGLTVYASGDHFVQTGEASVMGVHPDYVGRSLRLVALLVDRTYGLAAWAPVWLLAVVALATLVRRRPAGWALLALPALTGWAMATWAALTMHGFWWPGRQVVVVLPLLLVALLWWIDRSAGPLGRAAAALLGVVGLASTAALLVDGWGREITWVSGFELVDDPLYAWARVLLPDYRGDLATGDWLRHAAWILVVAALALVGWRQGAGGPARGRTPDSIPTATPDDLDPHDLDPHDHDPDLDPDEPAERPELTSA